VGCFLGENHNVIGNLSDLSSNFWDFTIEQNDNVVFDGISHMTYAHDIRLANNNRSQAEVDTIIDGLYDAVIANPNHFSHSTPSLKIGGDNAAPSGTYQYSANPSTGLEKVYFLCHLDTHHWLINWSGGTGP
jgi:hypothetical protein